MQNENNIHNTNTEEEIVLEEASTSTEEQSQDENAKLHNQILELEDKLVRSVAEMENLRRRYDKMLDEAKEYSIANFAKDMLSVMDNLMRALEAQIEQENAQMQSIYAGISMTKTELEAIFKKNGVDSITPSVGDKFDYNLHYAISQVASEGEEGTIMNVVQAGYKIKDRLLRPAMVAVIRKVE